MFRFLRFFAGAAIAATLLAVPFMISSAVISTNTVSVIVEFRDDLTWRDRPRVRRVITRREVTVALTPLPFRGPASTVTNLVFKITYNPPLNTVTLQLVTP